MKKIIAIIGCFIVIVTVQRVYGERKSIYAWFLTAKFQPVSNKIESIRVRKIDPSWKKATVLSHEILPEEAKSNPYSLEGPGRDFRIEGDFNRDGKKDIALVGVYEDKEGELGRFILILSRIRWWKLQRTFLKKFPGSNGFLKLRNDGKKIFWSRCMHCDGGGEIAWTGSEYEFSTWTYDE